MVETVHATFKQLRMNISSLSSLYPSVCWMKTLRPQAIPSSQGSRRLCPWITTWRKFTYQSRTSALDWYVYKKVSFIGKISEIFKCFIRETNGVLTSVDLCMNHLVRAIMCKYSRVCLLNDCHPSSSSSYAVCCEKHFLKSKI